METPEIAFLHPEEFDQVNQLFLAEGAPPLDPNFSKVIVARLPSNQIVGLMALQMVPHAEPIIVREDYRKTGLWKDLAEAMDGYLQALQIPGAYTQPIHGASEAICRKMGFVPADHPLWVKMYNPDFKHLMPESDLS